MPKKPDIPPGLTKYVTDVGAPVTPDDVDTYGKLQDIKDRSHWVRSIVNAWKNQQTQDRTMRKQYATCLMVALAIQIAIVNVVYILMGCGVLTFDAWTARTFIMAVFAEVAAMVFFIVKYLFRTTGDKVLELAAPPKKQGRSRGATDGD